MSKIMKQKEIRDLIRYGHAINVSTTKEDIPESYTEIGYSAGTYGMNGLLLKGDSGKLYAVVGRTTNIFRFSK